MKRLSPPRALSIRSRLLLFLILSVILTALAISVVTAVVGTREAHSRVVGQLQSVVNLKKQEISAWTGSLRLNLDIVLSATETTEDLRTVTLPPSYQAVWKAAYNNVRERFLWAVLRMGLFEELFFMDTEGVVLLSTEQSHERQRLGLNDYFVEGMKAQYLEQPTYSLSLEKMTVVASAPVIDRGQTIGVIAGRADLDGLNEIMLERAGLGDSGETYLVASNYRLLTDLRQPGFTIPDTYVHTEGTDAAVGLQQQGSGTYKSYSGASVIGVYEWVPDLQVALVAEQEEAEALAPTRVALLITASVAILAAALAIVAAIALTRRIVRPLAKLGDTAAHIAAGELDLEAEVEREDEIGTLAHSFNRMTTRLRDLVRSLERRTDHLRAINEAGRQISGILELKQLLPYVARSLLEKFDYRSVQILLLDEGPSGKLFTCDSSSECAEPAEITIDSPACHQAVRLVVETGQHQLVEADPHAKGAPRETEIAVPIRIRQDLVGVMHIGARRSHPLDEQDLFAAQTLADQLSIAIENSRLYEQANELAASRERQRLARDLHDAVSQTLFSVSLIAEVLPRIYERDREQGRERLEELRQLTRGALAEMRTLLLELRPAALAEAELPDLLRQLGEATMSRARIPVDVEAADDCCDLPVDVRIALYHIAQEALNNVAKHSGATKAHLRLASEGPGVVLLIEDDGTGFDRTKTGSGQLGLGIMSERAEALGASLEIESTSGRGTKVTVHWAPATTAT